MSYLDDLNRMNRMFGPSDAMENFRKQLDFVAAGQKQLFEAVNLDAISGARKQVEALDFGAVAGVRQQVEAVNLDAISGARKQVEAFDFGAVAGVRQQIEALNLNAIAGVRQQIDALSLDAMAGSKGAQLLAERQAAEMARYFESPSYDVLRGLLRPDVLPQSFAASLHFPRWMQDLAGATRILSAEYQSVLNTGIDALARESARQAAWLRSVQSAASPALSMFADDLVASAREGRLTPALAEGFGAQVLGYINETQEAQTEEEREAVLQEFFAWFVEQFKRAPRTAVSAQGLLSIFFLLVSLLDNHWLSAGMDRHIDSAISGLESRVDARFDGIEEGQKKILEELGEIKAQKNSRATYVVMKAAQLREGPREGFKALRVLPPNLLVEEIEHEDGWVHVTFFDYPNGREAQGWVSASLIADKHIDGKPEP
jgi:hypothetical protein